jgi:hypothetical protein
MTYKVKEIGDVCEECGKCSFIKIEEEDVYQCLGDKKLYAHIGDGHDCYSMMEVIPEE